MSEDNSHKKRQDAAQHAFQDVLGQLRTVETNPVQQPDPQLDGMTVAKLLEKNFARLDPNGNGITREELAQALLSKGSYSNDEYAMLQLIGKYFDTIANMAEDEVGPQSVITSLDKDVLNQFLAHSNLSLSELHTWRSVVDESN